MLLSARFDSRVSVMQPTMVLPTHFTVPLAESAVVPVQVREHYAARVGRFGVVKPASRASEQVVSISVGW